MAGAPEPSDIQGLVRRQYRYQFSRHILLQIQDPAAARHALAVLLPRITTAAQDLSQSPEPLINIGVTWTGLVKLGALQGISVEAARIAFDGDFSQKPGPSLGDWRGRFSASDVDLAVQIHCRTEAMLAATTAEIRQWAAGGFREHTVSDSGGGALSGQAFGGGLMHFGVLDGISEPDINWDDDPLQTDMIDLRHVLLGYSTTELQSYPNEEPLATLVRNGTYAVFQWIYQDVAAFEQYLDAAAGLLAPHLSADQARHLLRAKMLGRWDDGTPLALSPDGPDPTKSQTAFGYLDDPQGAKCPLHAHVRLANRRDQPLNALEAATFPKDGPHLLRRGLPYGPPLVGSTDDHVDRGLIGMFLCANLRKQYFTVLKWMNRADFSPVFDPRRSHLQDMMMADRTFDRAEHAAVIPINGAAPQLPALTQFIQVRGTLLLFMPALSGLTAMTGTPP